MSIPDQALQKVYQEIESKALSSQREINIVKTAIAAKHRDIRMLELTSTEVKELSKDTKVYQGVGKMFMFSPTSDIEKRLSSEIVELKSDISNLNKKLHFVETTHKNSREAIERMIQSGGRS